MSHGNHLFFGSPLVDLLHVTQEDNLPSLFRQYKKGTVALILNILTRIYSEYQCMKPTHSEVIANGDIIVFHLCPTIAEGNDTLISRDQINKLSDLIEETKAQASVVGKSPMLIIATPIPLITPGIPSVEVAELTFVPATLTQTIGACYSPSEVTRILDLLFVEWMSAGRELLILSTAGQGYVSSITVESLEDDDIDEDTPEATILFKQICVGSFINGATSEPQNTNQRIQLLSKKRQYVCTYEGPTPNPHVSLLTWSSPNVLPRLDFLAYNDIVALSTLDPMINNEPLKMIWDKAISHINAHDSRTHESDENSQVTLQSKKSKLEGQEALSSEFDEVAMKMLDVLQKIFKDQAKLFRVCHDRYKSLDSFNSSLHEVSSQAGSQAVMMIWKECLNKYLPQAMAGLLPQPSSFIVRRMWETHVDQMSTGSDETVLANEITHFDRSFAIAMASALRLEAGYFIRFLRRVMSAQVLCEHFAYRQGQLLKTE